VLRLRKYLKPLVWGILAAIVLLFVQAISDLNQPNHMFAMQPGEDRA
jgi:ATP-binding cassette subfamily B protein